MNTQVSRYTKRVFASARSRRCTMDALPSTSEVRGNPPHLIRYRDHNRARCRSQRNAGPRRNLAGAAGCQPYNRLPLAPLVHAQWASEHSTQTGGLSTGSDTARHCGCRRSGNMEASGASPWKGDAPLRLSPAVGKAWPRGNKKPVFRHPCPLIQRTGKPPRTGASTTLIQQAAINLHPPLRPHHHRPQHPR